jgi:hypothetical protein
MTPRIHNALLIAGFALLAILAVAGWTRNPTAVAAAPGALNASFLPPVTTSPYGAQQQNAVQYSANPNCVETLAGPDNPRMQSAAYVPADSGYRTYSRPRVIRYVNPPAPVVRREFVEGDRARTEVVTARRRGRSTGKSVAIVGGSAGVGAAIGAIAGGGKGAGIGALAGGTGGFIYDRLTHNR